MTIDPRYDPAFQRGYDQPGPESAGPSVVAPVDTRRNPWLAVLWGLAVLLIAGGVVLLTVVPSAETATGVYVLPVVLPAVAPWVVGAGLAALVAAVTLHAVRWQQR